MLSTQTIRKINLIRDFLNFLKHGCEIGEENKELLLNTKFLDEMVTEFKKTDFKIPETYSKTQELAYFTREEMDKVISFAMDYTKVRIDNGQKTTA